MPAPTKAQKSAVIKAAKETWVVLADDFLSPSLPFESDPDLSDPDLSVVDLSVLVESVCVESFDKAFTSSCESPRVTPERSDNVDESLELVRVSVSWLFSSDKRPKFMSEIKYSWYRIVSPHCLVDLKGVRAVLFFMQCRGLTCAVLYWTNVRSTRDAIRNSLSRVIRQRDGSAILDGLNESISHVRSSFLGERTYSCDKLCCRVFGKDRSCERSDRNKQE